jgi:hypothetical protein
LRLPAAIASYHEYVRYLIGAYLATLGVLVAFAVIGGALVLHASGPSGPLETVADQHSFSLFRWEVRHFPEKWLYKIGDFFHGNSQGSDEDVLTRYFTLTSKMSALQQADPGSAELTADESERAGLENTVENIIEGRVTSILKEQGLTMGPPPFTDLGLVFPPVDFEFDQPPRVLVTSPRDHITLTHDYLLTPGISPDQIDSIESDAEKEPNTSALVVGTGGVSTYPSVEDNLDSYEHLIEIVFHEWTHSYLAFFPLGSRYFNNSELRTLNETVATISGEQLAQVYFQQYPHLDLPAESTSSPSPSPSPAPGEQPFDFTTAMRDLRRQVESLLAEGNIDEAETLMNQKRDEFAAKGYTIRKLNQAYFAFYGFYGTSAGSIDPIGPKVQQLFASTASPGEFLRQARSLTSQADLDRLLGEFGSS